MRRICFFAHYDRDGVVDDYVLYYLRGLQNVTDRVLFASDCELPPEELEKLDGLAKIVHAAPHKEYDFGSWKRCLEAVGYDLTGWDELILANDSCYAPVYPFEGAFERMTDVECDFWSPTSNWDEDGEFDHLSSYFLVLRKPILSNPRFLNFIRSIRPQESPGVVIQKYEIGLSRLLDWAGYKWGSLAPIAGIGSFSRAKYVRETMHELRIPWLKVRLVRDNPLRVGRLGKALERVHEVYPRRLMNNHLVRMIGTDAPAHHRFSVSGDWRIGWRGLEIVSRFKRGKPHKQEGRRFDWHKIYAYVFGVPVFAFVIPVRRS